MRIKYYLLVVILCLFPNWVCAKNIFASGYIEGEFTYISAIEAGILKKVYVKKGVIVDKGQLLFQLDTTVLQADLEQAKAKLKQAQSVLANLHKGKRSEELKVIVAQKEQAEADLKLSKNELTRSENLYKNKAISQSKLDLARANYKKDIARVEELQAEWKTATLGAREDEIKSAEANILISKAEVNKAVKKLSDMTPISPNVAIVEEVYFREGEVVPSATPVISLLIKNNIKLRFYIDEPNVGKLKLGQEVKFSCDGCKAAQKAKINFISSQIEYTPPQIYSVENRRKFMFMVEAVPNTHNFELHPGQPIDVEIQFNE
jgi:HlyD family secretion protein